MGNVDQGPGSVHEPESVWVVDLGDNDETNRVGILEFVGRHLACGELRVESFSGEFADFETAAATLLTRTS